MVIIVLQLIWTLTYGVEIVKDFVDPDQLVVKLIVGCGVRQERVAVRDKKVKDLYHLCSNDNQDNNNKYNL